MRNTEHHFPPNRPALRKELSNLLADHQTALGLHSLVDDATFIIDGQVEATMSDGDWLDDQPKMVVTWSSVHRVFCVAVFEVEGKRHEAGTQRRQWVQIMVSVLLKIKQVAGEVICLPTHLPSMGQPIRIQQRVIKGLPQPVARTEVPIKDILDRFPSEVKTVLGHVSAITTALFGKGG